MQEKTTFKYLTFSVAFVIDILLFIYNIPMPHNPLPRSFYIKDNVVDIAKSLIWKILYSNIDGRIVWWMITETEAYRGYGDRACHGRICTPRTQIMFGEWWYVYTYLCYGIHVLFNVVTNTSWKSDAILIRSIQPIEWIEYILERLKKNSLTKNMTTWPWKISKALGINLTHYWTDLLWKDIRIEQWPKVITSDEIIIWPRVGVDYAWEDALLPRRFTLAKL